MTRPACGSDDSARADWTRLSYRVVPSTGSTASERRALWASAADVEKLVNTTGLVAKVATATRSSRCFAPRNAYAAATASENGLPFIDCERSTASTTLFARPRFSASAPLTGRPFSSTRGARVVGDGVTTLIRTAG